MSAPRIFISMGTPFNDKYSQFRDDLESFLRDKCQCDPRIIGKNEYPDGNPLTHIREVMLSCHGVLVVAYERKYVESGTEKRNSNAAKTLQQHRLTTTWNHIESAMAFGLKMPLYVLCEEGVAEEGLIESKLDWHVQQIELNKKALDRPEVAESLRSWVNKRVAPRAKTPDAVRAILGTLKISEMTPKEIAIFLGTLSGIFLAGAAFAKWLPNLFQ